MRKARLRRWAAWGARRGPDWFVAAAPVLIGVISFFVAHRARRAVVRNLRRIFGRKEPLGELIGGISTFIQFARNLTEALCPERFIAHRRLVVRGRSRADEVLAHRGAIFVTAHIGPWDSAAMMLSQLSNRPILMLMADEFDEEASSVQDEVRTQESIQVVRLGASPFSSLPTVAHLEEGGIVVAQLDRPFGGRTPISAQLCGHPFSVAPGLFRLAASLQVALVPVFMARREGGARLVQVGDPIRVKYRPSFDELHRAAQDFVSQMERHLLDFPYQWFHFVDEESSPGE